MYSWESGELNLNLLRITPHLVWQNPRAVCCTLTMLSLDLLSL